MITRNAKPTRTMRAWAAAYAVLAVAHPAAGIGAFTRPSVEPPG